MKILIFLFGVLYIQGEVVALDCNCVDYYWRDFCGRIPDDAFVGGYNRTGEPRYIASTYYPGRELQVAMLYPNGLSIGTANNDVLYTTQNIRVLCTKHPEALRWININNSNFEQYRTTLNLVIGGSEIGQTLYVARILRNGEWLIGKAGMAYPDIATNRPGFSTTYDLLYYDCQSVRCPVSVY